MANTSSTQAALIPNPTLVRAPRPIIAHNGTADLSTIPFAEGYAWVNTVAQSVIIPCAGSGRLRIRWLSAAAGSLTAAFLRPDMITPYTANNPGAVAIVGGTENKMDIDPNFGEAAIKLTFTPSSSAAHTYSDVSETWL